MAIKYWNDLTSSTYLPYISQSSLFSWPGNEARAHEVMLGSSCCLMCRTARRVSNNSCLCLSSSTFIEMYIDGAYGKSYLDECECLVIKLSTWHWAFFQLSLQNIHFIILIFMSSSSSILITLNFNFEHEIIFINVFTYFYRS